MANALQWIIKEAKHLRRKDRNRKEWRDYVAQASAIYARKHKGKSPVGKPRRKVGYKGRVPRKHTDSPPPDSVQYLPGYKGSHKSQINGVKREKAVLGAVSAGILTAELKRRIKDRIDAAVVRKYHATTKRDKKKIQKTITAEKAKLRRLA